MSEVYDKLYFGSLTFDTTATSTTFGPNFTCPKCEKQYNPAMKLTKAVGKTLDFNQNVAFICPSCGAKIQLYVAVYYSSTVKNICIATEPIASNWWVEATR